MMYHAGEKSLRVSIPRSEFWSFGREREIVGIPMRERFNSSVGILVVRTG